MLTEQQYVRWCRSLGFTQQTNELLDQIRAAPPARRVGGGRQNVTGRYPSRKMGVTIQFESHSNELAAVLEYENDPDCLEFYDQPQPRLSLEYQAKNGRRLRVLHTADFFVLRRQSAGWVECKTEPDLLSLAARSPARFQHASNGSWHCPPGTPASSGCGTSSARRGTSTRCTGVIWSFWKTICVAVPLLSQTVRARPSSRWYAPTRGSHSLPCSVSRSRVERTTSTV